MKLNLGSGKSRYEGFIGMDIELSNKPDILADMRESLPFKSNIFDEIWLIHVIEHIERVFHQPLLLEISRVLKENGKLVIGYPEFEECLKNYLSNKQGMRQFWEHTIYGRQAWKGDYHVTAMRTEDLVHLLKDLGFGSIKFKSDSKNDFCTVLSCRKLYSSITKEDIFKRELFPNEHTRQSISLS